MVQRQTFGGLAHGLSSVGAVGLALVLLSPAMAAPTMLFSPNHVGPGNTFYSHR